MTDEEKEQEIAEEYSAGPEHSRFYAAWNASRTSQPEPPDEILQCARKLELWMNQNGHRNWQLLGVCDRSFAIRLEKIMELLKR